MFSPRPTAQPPLQRTFGRLAWLFFILAANLTIQSQAWAQKPVPGEWYEETRNLGFRVRAPKDWTYVPPQPDDSIMLAKYVPTGRDYIPLSGDDRLYVFGWILRFDLEALKQNRIRSQLARYGAKSIDEVPEQVRDEIDQSDPSLQETFEEWVRFNMLQGNGFERQSNEPIKMGSTPAEEWIYEGVYGSGNSKTKGGFPIKLLVGMFEVAPKQHVAVVYNGSGDRGEWNKYEGAYKKMVRSFDLIKKDTASTEPAAAEGDLRGKKRQQLEASIASMPGWWILETENYFLLTDSTDKSFIEEIAVRLEAIRDIYERDYPADKARSVVNSTGEGAEEEDEGGGRTVAGKKHLDLSRTSVARICQDQEMYHSYGGPGGSAGYWNPGTEELVLYDDKQGGGRANTYAVLNHEAFHQYIFYFYGSLSPHSWYNEGTGDFYSGYQFNIKRKKFELEPFDWRTGTIKEILRNEDHVPLKTFVRWSQAEYYGNNEFGAGGGENYAQGWSFIWFLRHGKGKPKGWNAAWDGILESYLDTLATTGDLDKGVDVAFKGVDWEELEKCWINYIR
jgi:hypothetical protein